jgi:hypothetical protein
MPTKLQKIKKRAYETKLLYAHVVLDPETNRKRIRFDSDKYFQHEVNQFTVGDEVSVYMTSKRPKRSEAQNKYMHVFFHLIGLASGHTMKEIKSWAKGKVLTKGITEVFGDKVRMITDTSEMNVSEFMEFIARIEVITGIPAPDPGPFKIPMTFPEYKKLRDREESLYKGMKVAINI